MNKRIKKKKINKVKEIEEFKSEVMYILISFMLGEQSWAKTENKLYNIKIPK